MTGKFRSLAIASSMAIGLAVVSPAYASPIDETTFSGTVDFEQSMRIKCNVGGKIKYEGNDVVLYDIKFSPGNFLCGTVVKPNGKEWRIVNGVPHSSSSIIIENMGASTALGGYCEGDVPALIVDQGANHKITISGHVITGGTPSDCIVHLAEITTS